ncbi:hypothetical protein TrLO_g13289 [Triparma laevis f. longispina]|uniref:Kinesin motor domain-containing protein n=1 Tax=Triparma laevis f. longispina TaxID=1714387 RepID=A0A9W7FGF6_9STRA|nr:hypothetical protein TrLO_g13289 [Triparma laevis f. longispina]
MPPKLTPTIGGLNAKKAATAVVAAKKLSNAAANKAKAPLKASEVYVRIRPVVRDGSGWGDTSVTLNTAYLFSDGQCEYAFPKHVLYPEVAQEDVFEKSNAGESVRSFVTGENDTIFLAYGQTGTGKTHTIFGIEESLRGCKFRLGISAVEFYNGRVLDLVNTGSQVLISETHTCIGHTLVPLSSTSDIFPVVSTVISNRKLKAPVVKRGKGKDLAKTLNKARKDVEEAEKAVENLAEPGTPAAKFNYKKKAKLKQAKHMLEFIELLRG